MSDADALARVIRNRRSVRLYRREAVPPEMIEHLLELATWAPSAANRQDWEFVVVSSAETKGAMAAAVREEWDRMVAGPEVESFGREIRAYARNFDWFAFAPVVIVVTARTPEMFLDSICGPKASAVHGSSTSAAMAAQNLMLAAHAMGLATCCLTGPVAAEEKLKKLLGLGQRRELVCLITLGYPAETPQAPSRRPVTDIAGTAK